MTAMARELCYNRGTADGSAEANTYAVFQREARKRLQRSQQKYRQQIEERLRRVNAERERELEAKSLTEHSATPWGELSDKLADENKGRHSMDHQEHSCGRLSEDSKENEHPKHVTFSDVVETYE